MAFTAGTDYEGEFFVSKILQSQTLNGTNNTEIKVLI